MKNLSILYSENDNVNSHAVYSPCKQYRYELTRQWSDNNKRMLFILLNPSTATERKNDPTVERCEKRARNLNYGAYRVCNIFSYRATNPLELRNSADPAVKTISPGKNFIRDWSGIASVWINMFLLRTYF